MIGGISRGLRQIVVCRKPDRRARSIGVVRRCAVLGVAIATSLSFAAAEPSQPDSGQRDEQLPLKEAIGQLLSEPDALPLPVRQRKDALRQYYEDPQSRLLWRDPENAAAFLQRLRHAYQDGLDVDDYPIESLIAARRLNRLALTARSQALEEAAGELYWSAFFLRYCADIKVGRFLPTKVEPNLFWQEKSINMAAALQLLAGLKNVDAFLSAWQPQIPDYANLRLALAEYRALEASGGWPMVPVGDVLKPGETSDGVPALRRRLVVTDGAPQAAAAGQETVYSEDLVEAVKRFQRRHGLDDDGVIGKQTYFQLNIPIADRIRQIVMSMERWRWMPEDLGKHYIKVNIAGFELKRVENGAIRERMRVVVGQPYHQTPVFSETMKYVEINPYWNVPYSIAVNEELPKLQSRPASLAAQGFEAVVNDKPVPVTAIDWSRYSRSNFPVQLRQRPGQNNALGRVKFMFPNRFNVYMHDTPARTLFGEASRAFSHGCIRLARPIDMAEQVLTTVPGWDRGRLEKVVAEGQRTVVSLTTPIVVHITYATAWRDTDGDIEFRPDIYRRDEKLYAALFGRPYPF